MAERDRQHIVVDGRRTAEPYRRPPQAIPGRPLAPPPDPAGHAAALIAQLERADDESSTRRQVQGVHVEGTAPGAYIVFESFPGIDLALESLDPRQGKMHPELRNAQRTVVNGQEIELATVRVPEGGLGYFLRRLQRYAATVDQDTPRHRDLVDRIHSIGLASLRTMWTDAPEEFPAGDETVWWEVWLRRRDGLEIERLRTFAHLVDVQVSPRTLAFPDRLVALLKATPAQLTAALDVLDDLAELRKPRAAAELLAQTRAVEQAAWVEDLRSRTTAAPTSSPAVCVVDTGVHQTHPLLIDSLPLADCHTCDPSWHVGDHHGHGTEMAGIALYGNLSEAILLGTDLHLRHGLESVKLRPPAGAIPPELWGAVTATAVSLVEIRAPLRRRVFSVATTADYDGPHDAHGQERIGQPSSWSAAVDALAAGLGVEVTDNGTVFLRDATEVAPRLFVLAAGNIDDFQDEYIERCDIEPVEDPAQAWNAVTVGAYTDLMTIDPDEPGYEGWAPLAPAGELSPYSRTSVAFHRSWPVKPDVVLEGGNVARSPNGSFDWPYSFQLLTTKAPLRDARLLTVTRQTSAATAQAAHLAASIQAEYPSFWPETVRALIVHSAEWTPAMRAEVNAAQLRKDRDVLRRRYGMGVPTLARATRSATDALTLVVQDVIHPFDGEGRMREMHVLDLPWPSAVLTDLADVPVRLRVTLSYFIEPNPACRGWARRYRYASHGLRFDVRQADESTEEFRKRINERALTEEEHRPTRHGSDSPEWCFGPDLRKVGSLHADIWRGRAVDLARRGVIAVYPVSGWWKERPSRDQSERGARYALVVSIETPGQDVDIWTPVAQEVGIPVEITA